MSTIFSKIIAGELPSFKLYEDDVCIVILDVFPSIEGQTLVILKREVDYLFDTTDKEYQHLLTVAKKITKALDTSLSAKRTCMVVEGFEVPHVHIKLYPFTELENVSLAKTISKSEKAADSSLQSLKERITAAL